MTDSLATTFGRRRGDHGNLPSADDYREARREARREKSRTAIAEACAAAVARWPDRIPEDEKYVLLEDVDAAIADHGPPDRDADSETAAQIMERFLGYAGDDDGGTP